MTQSAWSKALTFVAAIAVVLLGGCVTLEFVTRV
jgi:hypothetical protein